jgi:hypothetical protein
MATSLLPLFTSSLWPIRPCSPFSSAVETEVRKCLDQFGNGQVVDETGFGKYVESMGDFFTHMAIWREVFDR